MGDVLNFFSNKNKALKKSLDTILKNKIQPVDKAQNPLLHLALSCVEGYPQNRAVRPPYPQVHV